MKKKLLAGVSTGLLLVGMAGVSQATPMIGTMSATVTSKYMSESETGYNIGDVVTVSFTYDDSGTEWHEYNDNANTIAEYGGGDDTLREVYTTATYTMWSFMSDAQIVLPSALSALAYSYNLNFTNTSRVGLKNTGVFDLQIFGDGLNVMMNTGPHNSRIGWVNKNNEPNYLYLSQATLVTSTVDPVPEPATMLLFGTSLSGLAGARLRRKKKA